MHIEQMELEIGHPHVAEFFAGIGLMRMGLEHAGMRVAWANDIEASKQQMYMSQFGDEDFHLGDVRNVRGAEMPDIELATASFPCTDLSLAGNRLGFRGQESAMFWEFARVLREMRGRRPPVILLENVPAFASSHGGHDLYLALKRLSRLGYWCDLLVVDARHFVPQSRPRLFIVGSREPLKFPGDWTPSPVRPKWLRQFVKQHPDLLLNPLPFDLPDSNEQTLGHIVERLEERDERWWDNDRLAHFMAQLSPIQRSRLNTMMARPVLSWATAYRRTRSGTPAWEIRADAISGCLRTARGGSSKQAMVEAGAGVVRVRWMTPVEYARLQGAGEYHINGTSESRALFGFGDAVCVPVISWIARRYLRPLLDGLLTQGREEVLIEDMSSVL